MAAKFYIIGKIHDRIKPKTHFLGPEITRDEADRFFDSLIGKPVCLEHDPTISIGKVVHIWESEAYGSQVLAQLEINPSTPGAMPCIKAVQQGRLRDLSFCQTALFNPETGERFSESTGVEISLVLEGAVENSRILAWGWNENLTISQSAQRLLKMSSDDNEVKRMRSTVEDISVDDIATLRAKARELDQIKQVEREKNARVVQANLEILASYPEVFDGIVTKEELSSGLEQAWKQDVPVLPSLISIAASASKSFGDVKSKFSSLQQENEALKQELAQLKQGLTRDEGVKTVTVSASSTVPRTNETSLLNLLTAFKRSDF